MGRKIANCLQPAASISNEDVLSMRSVRKIGFAYSLYVLETDRCRFLNRYRYFQIFHRYLTSCQYVLC